jgi:superfamily II DNA/RNA helicase
VSLGKSGRLSLEPKTMTLESNFASLGLAQPLLRAIADAGYETPTPIQLQAIPVVLTGRDLRAAAQTGTGKTAGFVLPILQRLSAPGPDGKPAQSRAGKPRCLVLVPTRELAAQVEESVRTYGKYLSMTSLVVFGGVNINPQISAMRGKIDILVATPGRLLDHLGQRTVDLSAVEVLVLDEADRMLDMGFEPQMRKIVSQIRPDRQTLLWSATWPREVKSIAAQFESRCFTFCTSQWRPVFVCHRWQLGCFAGAGYGVQCDSNFNRKINCSPLGHVGRIDLVCSHFRPRFKNRGIANLCHAHHGHLSHLDAKAWP